MRSGSSQSRGSPWQLASVNQNILINSLIYHFILIRVITVDCMIMGRLKFIFSFFIMVWLFFFLQGISFQSYALEPSNDMLFTDMYACAAEVASHVGPHGNWPQPIITQQPGCPLLLFSPEVFMLASNDWQCIDN